MLFFDNPLDTLDAIRELVDQNEQIALLMTDQMMPKMKGIDFLKAAREITPKSMRVLLTGYAGMDSAIVAINENVLDKYLTKPIGDFDDLVCTLKRLLNEFCTRSGMDAQHRGILDLYEFTSSLNCSRDLDTILEHLAAFTGIALHCERISILLLQQGELVYRAGIGIPADLAASIRIPVGENIAGRVLKERRAILVEDIDAVPWIEKKIDTEFRSFISVPLIWAQLAAAAVPLGVINVTNKADNETFNEHDLDALSFIANAASIAIKSRYDLKNLEHGYFDVVQVLITALEARNKYAKGHSLRVMDHAAGIARQLKLDQDTIKVIKPAAILHDIGYIGVRDEVFLKKGNLTAKELEEIRRHPKIGSAIVKSIASLQEVGTIVLQHHERFDGNGYPGGLKGQEIHGGARILAVADAFDDMTSEAPDHQAVSINEALKELRNGAGARFDKTCVDAFLQYIGDKGAEESGSVMPIIGNGRFGLMN
jgi:putative nucleotidyltransferase with HDIG domain